MSKPDLDEIPIRMIGGKIQVDPKDWDALLAELRAARDVIAEAQAQGHGPDTDNPNCVQCKAVTAYLKVTGESQ